jgi:hypothetical protein
MAGQRNFLPLGADRWPSAFSFSRISCFVRGITRKITTCRRRSCKLNPAAGTDIPFRPFYYVKSGQLGQIKQSHYLYLHIFLSMATAAPG